MPGTTFSFNDPGESHHESADVARAKAFIQHRHALLSSVVIMPAGAGQNPASQCMHADDVIRDWSCTREVTGMEDLHLW
jgi:hypothetical protein